MVIGFKYFTRTLGNNPDNWALLIVINWLYTTMSNKYFAHRFNEYLNNLTMIIIKQKKNNY